jgi:hypothetical protein
MIKQLKLIIYNNLKINLKLILFLIMMEIILKKKNIMVELIINNKSHLKLLILKLLILNPM